LPGDLALDAPEPEASGGGGGAERADGGGAPRGGALQRHLASAIDVWQRDPGALPLAASVERALFAEVLERCQGNQVKAARLLGIGRHALRHRIERLGLGGSGGDAVPTPLDEP
jgi:transcriptional regulator of acetoin/glycerol metabolism